MHAVSTAASQRNLRFATCGAERIPADDAGRKVPRLRESKAGGAETRKIRKQG